MAEPVTFALLKERWRNRDVNQVSILGDIQLTALAARKLCADEIESLERQVRDLRDKVADGIISGPMRDTNKDYDSGACDAEIAVEGALTALLGGQ